MNLSKLFEAQKKLDDRIVKEKGLEGQDLLDKKILALLVELGELANEWRGFKFWSENQNPNTKERVTDNCRSYNGLGFIDAPQGRLNCHCLFLYKNPLLEEYVDCLHFILSIGLDINVNCDDIAKPSEIMSNASKNQIVSDFLYLYWEVCDIAVNLKSQDSEFFKYYYENMCYKFLKLGNALGFTRKQIEQAYYQKNKINHERQDGGY